jgi:capsular exopolysaccharide synthesis family protein
LEYTALNTLERAIDASNLELELQSGAFLLDDRGSNAAVVNDAFLRQSPSWGIMPEDGEVPAGTEELLVRLLTQFVPGRLNSLAFVGPTEGVGTSTTASNTALWLARKAGKQVLLIDADLVTPTLHRQFCVEPYYDLNQIVLNQCEGGRPITIRKEKLHVIPARPIEDVNSILFQIDAFARFLLVAKGRYDFVIVDCAPVSASSSAVFICPKIDGTIFVVGAGRSDKRTARRALQQLSDAGSQFAGAILNRKRRFVPKWLS